ncbi:hypothetical protein DFH05DRAFT_185668 [Lentinula detonsa]|uniref:Uncharacterized protein n=1 Tax=Lentinula detonsa TaxID=2804962 RepID=A0A9W8PCH4_9AGAR|nr:hypothetical protein DFH05DRAFT_185668 [Lentinula detonsa]
MSTWWRRKLETRLLIYYDFYLRFLQNYFHVLYSGLAFVVLQAPPGVIREDLSPPWPYLRDNSHLAVVAVAYVNCSRYFSLKVK